MTEDSLDAQTIQFFVTLPGAFSWLHIGEVVVVEKFSVRQDRLLALFLGTRIGTEGDLRLHLLGARPGIGQTQIPESADFLMRRASFDFAP